MIRVHGLAKRFGDTRVLSGIDLELADGLLRHWSEQMGKTTLLRILARLAAPFGRGNPISCLRARRSATSVTLPTSIAS